MAVERQRSEISELWVSHGTWARQVEPPEARRGFSQMKAREHTGRKKRKLRGEDSQF